MTLFLRNEKNETILDIDLYEKEDYIELNSTVCIEPYSKLLLEVFSEDSKKAAKLIKKFDELQELRGWLWEVYFLGGKNTNKEFYNVLKAVKEMLKKVADEYNLYYVED